MGAGIAEVFARNGLPVVAIERDEAAIIRGLGHIEHSTARAVARGKLTAGQQRAILERLGAKAIMARLDEAMSSGTSPRAPVASNAGTEHGVSV